jgi:hypothetical protein
VLDVAADGHRAEPLSHVALVQAGHAGERGGVAGREGGEGVEEAGAVADGDHQRDAGLVEDAEEAGAEGVHLGGVKGLAEVTHGEAD